METGTLEGKAKAFRASPLLGGNTDSSSFCCPNFHIIPALAGLAIWPRLDDANTLGNTEVNFGPDDA